MLETVYGHKAVSCMCAANGLKDSERGMRTVNMSQGMDGREVTGIQEHLRKFITWWPETIK
jgi:hypothetical protein